MTKTKAFIAMLLCHLLGFSFNVKLMSENEFKDIGLLNLRKTIYIKNEKHI